ncbi:MAG: hypothetical protein KTR31_29085 [Myxococcales bacterium]|nr:hypothetical protein [Myxococcales bacterium]
MTLLTVLLACTTSPEGIPPVEPGTSTTPGTSEEIEIGEIAAVSADIDAGTPVVDALTLAEGLAFALDHWAIGDWAEDGDLDYADLGSGCVVPSIVDSELVLAFDQCGLLDGTMRLSFDPFGATVVTYDDDFSIDGVDLDGSVSADITLLALTFDLEGDVTYDAVDLVVDVHLELSPVVAMYGDLTVADPDEESTFALGSETDPITFGHSCDCPEDGVFSGSFEAPLTEVGVDLDVLVNPWDGSDEFPAMDVPVAPVDVLTTFEADFTATCGDPAFSLSTADVWVTVQTRDVQAALDAACLAGEVETADCNAATFVLGVLPASVPVPVLLSVLAAGAEISIDAALDDFCPL